MSGRTDKGNRNAVQGWIQVLRRMLCLGIALSLAPATGLRGRAQDVVRPPSIKLSVTAGQAATNDIRSRKAVEPVVLVRDERGQPLSGVMVIFTLPETGPGGNFADGSKRAILYTDSEGKAIARGLTPNMTQGKFQIMVHASFHGFTSSTIIDQTNFLSERRKGGSSKLLAILAIAGGAAAAGVVAASGGNGPSQTPVPPPGRTTTIFPGTPVFGAPQQ